MFVYLGFYVAFNTKERFEEHQENKAKVREMKEEDKKKAKMNSNHRSACFDLQQVLEIPYSEVSLFYKRKLHVYNLSLYDFGTNDGHCYVWPQTVGRRGSSEIASMVYDFLNMKSKNGAQSVVLYSDKCGGQNRNKYIISMYAYAIQRINIESITHRFLESGHSQNENDSIHGVIEKSRKGVSVFVPKQYFTLIAKARSKPHKPYIVNEVHQGMIFDFKKVASCMKNFNVGENGCRIKWINICETKLMKREPFQVKRKYSHASTEEVTLNLQRKARGKTSTFGSPSSTLYNCHTIEKEYTY